MLLWKGVLASIIQRRSGTFVPRVGNPRIIDSAGVNEDGNNSPRREQHNNGRLLRKSLTCLSDDTDPIISESA